MKIPSLSLFLTMTAAAVCFAAEQCIDRIDAATVVIRSENGNWGGINGSGLFAMLSTSTVAEKRFDLKQLPPELIASAKSAALRMHIGILDNNIYTGDNRSPGLRENFEISINGHRMPFKTSNKRFPLTVSPSKPRLHRWMNLGFPAEWLKGASALTVRIRKLDAVDDIVYQSVDPGVSTSFSRVSGDKGKHFSKTWNNSRGKGEFMIRLVLSSDPEMPAEKNQMMDAKEFSFTPGAPGTPHGVFGYARQEEQAFRTEITPGFRDNSLPMTVTLEGVKMVRCLDILGSELALRRKQEGGALTVFVPAKVELLALETAAAPKRVRARFTPLKTPLPPVRLQQAVMAPPAGKRQALCDIRKIEGRSALLDNGALRLKFSWDKGLLRIDEIFARDTGVNLVSRPDRFRLFIVRIGEKDFDASNCPVKAAEPEGKGIRTLFELPGTKLAAVWRIRNEGREFISSLEVVNNGASPVKVKVVHPCMDALKISAAPEDDFYLCPTEGGLIAKAPCWRREAYGYGFGYCVFGLLDLFSPEKGGGFYLRADDPTGLYKHFNLRKSGKPGKGDEELRLWPIMGRLDLTMHYGRSLLDLPGTSFAIDYLERECAPGETVRFPAAAMGGHPGDWHRAMEIYAAWSHKTWRRHAPLSPIAGCWSCAAGAGTGEPLGAFYKVNHPAPIPADLTEINGYWTVYEKGIWGEKLTEKTHLTFIDPADGKRKLAYIIGDYGRRGYNPQWGGLPALREFIRGIRNRMPLILYAAPRICHSETLLAKEHMPEWCIINPNWHFRKRYAHPLAPTTPKDMVFNFGAYRLCLENPACQQWLEDTIIRVLKETGASGIRLDEFGSSGEICLSTMHKHVPTYRKGHNNHLQAISAMTRRLRERMDREVGKDTLLLTEFIGSDMFNATQDGALSWLTATNDYTVNPAPIQLYRFYFPACKIFEVDEFKPGAAKRKDWRYWLWNGEGAYNSGWYPREILKLLHENNDALGFGKATPLIPTLAPYILINRFEAENGKTVWTVLNTDRKTFHGAIMTAEPGRKYEEILFRRGVETKDGKVITTIHPSEVLVLRSVK